MILSKLTGDVEMLKSWLKKKRCGSNMAMKSLVKRNLRIILRFYLKGTFEVVNQKIVTTDKDEFK